MQPPLVRCLSIHADYRCRHAGSCCTAGWPIPVDERQQRGLAEAVRDGRLRLAQPVPDDGLFVPAPGGRASLACVNGACVFYESGSTGLCAIHRRLGERQLPPSCRHFPRVALLDARGVSLTLSHYCPTAAALLFRDDVPLAIVENPAAFPSGFDYEGLDARHVLPPLLRPGLLWDLDAYSRWEEQAVAVLARDDLSPEGALDLIRRAAGEIEAWRPGREALADRVAAAFDSLEAPQAAGTAWEGGGRAVKRYLAARLFASWVPYRAERLRALVDDLEQVLGLLARAAARQTLIEAIRATDLRVVHDGSTSNVATSGA